LLRRWPTASSVKLEKNRMIVQLPDTVDRVRAERIVCKPGLLEFSLMASSAVTESVIERVNKYLGRHQVADLEMGASSSLYLYVAFAEGDLAVATSDVPFVRRLIDHVETAGICGEYRFCFGPEQRVAGRNVQKLYLLHRKPELSTLDGKVISRAFERAYVGADPSVTNTFIVDFALSRTANSRYNPIVKFAEVTQRFVGERLAIVLDSEVQSAPVIRSRIPDGSGMIMTGDRDGAKARELADILSTGALPVALEVVSDER
jgi:preprotein translocase subunit SecD